MEWNEMKGERERRERWIWINGYDVSWVAWFNYITLHREMLRVAVMKIIIAAYGIDV